MKTHILAVGLALLALSNAAKAQDNVPVPVIPQDPPYYGLWADTGISVTNGEWLNVNASGIWDIYYLELPSTPDGFIGSSSDLFFGNNIQGGLIAYVGADPFQGEWSPSGGNTFFPQYTNYWQVGTSLQFFSTTNGELWLGFNSDAVDSDYRVNNGSTLATVSTGFNTNNADYGVGLKVEQVSSNSFSFSISNGIPSSVCAIYDSSDLRHWTLIDSVLLSTNVSFSLGYPVLASAGINNVSGVRYSNTTGVPYRFYKVTDGQFFTGTIGFARLLVGPGTTNAPGANSLIANQFNSAAGNTLNGLFNPMPDGTYLPAGTAIMKWNGSAYDIYTWDGSSWGAGGSVTLNPGEAAFLVNPTTNAIPVTFAGSVDEGSPSLAFSGSQYAQTSSLLPEAGDIESTLDYLPHNDDQVLIWTGSSYVSHKYSSTTSRWVGNEPILQVGEGFFLNPASTNVWLQNYSSRHF